MRYFYYTTLFLFLSITLNAQNVQWASKVIKFSSEYGEIDFAAHQVLGVPNAMGRYEQSRFAWAPNDKTLGKEYVWVEFDKAINVQQIIVAESFNAGAISEIELFDNFGKSYTVFEEKNPKGSFERARYFNHIIEKTSYRVKQLKLTINTKSLGSLAQIDAIAISSSKDAVKPQINAIEYQEEIERPENLGAHINSEYPERLPIISPDGKTLYFTRKLHPENMGEEGKDDIWVATLLRNNQWSIPKNIGKPLNTKDHNFVIAISPDNQQIFLANDYNSKAKDGLSTSFLKNGTWTKPKTLNIKDHYNKNDFVAYHLSTDGKTLVMAVERNDSYGDRDLYVSFQQADGDWTHPKNLGKTINTIGMESSVFLAADGKTIYFSSSGHWGYGGLDMYKSERLDDTWTNWTTPQNLGEQINTPGMDYNYTIPVSGEYAYFSSDYNSYGMSDLFRIKLPQEARPNPVMFLTGRILNAETKEPIKGKISYKDLQNQNGLTSTDIKTDKYKISLPYGKDYSVFATTEGYFPVSESLELSDDGIEEEDGRNVPSRTDREVERLKSKLNRVNSHLNKFEKVENKNSSQKNKKSDKELNDLYSKFGKHSQSTKKENSKEKQEKEEFNSLKSKFNRHHGITSEVREELREEMRADIKKELRTELKDEVKDELRKELRSELKEELRAEVEAALKDDFEEDWREEIRREIRREMREDVEDELREEMRELLKEDVKEDLKKELRAEVKKELVEALEYKLTKEIEADLRKNLEIKLRAQIEEEIKNEQAIQDLEKEKKEKIEAKYQEKEKDILVVPIKVGQVIPMNNVFFEANEANIKNVSYEELDRVLHFLKTNSTVIVEIGGHTNGLCSHEFANELSTDRANIIRNYFIDKGITENRIQAHGYGKTNPIAPNNTITGRKKNQRVELKIVEIK